MDQKENEVKGSWAAFEEASVRSGVPKATSKWYVRWAHKFAVSSNFCTNALFYSSSRV